MKLVKLLICSFFSHTYDPNNIVEVEILGEELFISECVSCHSTIVFEPGRGWAKW